MCLVFLASRISRAVGLRSHLFRICFPKPKSLFMGRFIIDILYSTMSVLSSKVEYNTRISTIGGKYCSNQEIKL